MVPLNSAIIGREEAFEQVRGYFHEHEFVLGGNWDYNHGYFDRHLDEARTVWLRIPLTVTRGVLDGDTDSTDAIVKIGTPFVLKHLYNDGLDAEAHANTFGALVDQFQEPVNKDAPVGRSWIEKAEKLLRKVEESWLQ